MLLTQVCSYHDAGTWTCSGTGNPLTMEDDVCMTMEDDVCMTMEDDDYAVYTNNTTNMGEML